jgi:hypothetical protein
MLSKVSEPNHLTTPNIINWFEKNAKSNNTNIERIQDNLEGYLLIKYKNNPKTKVFNYYLNRYYSHNQIQVHWNDNIILKQIDSFDQNNWIQGNKLRTYVFNLINRIDLFEFKINSILGIGGEYYLYWIGFMKNQIRIKNLIGISNHLSIISDANLNIRWSSNYFVDYNKLETFPKISHPIDLILINLSQLNSNIIKYIREIKFNLVILIICNLSDSKLKLLKENFIIKKIKYFRNFDNLIRVIMLANKNSKSNSNSKSI